MGAGGRAGVYFLKCPLTRVPEQMTGCKREMERKGGEDEERNGGEVNYKPADSPRASPSLCSHVWCSLGEPRCTLRSCPDDRHRERCYHPFKQREQRH